MIYFDNASTYHPKSPRIVPAVQTYLRETIASPGRGGHRQGRAAGVAVDHVRELLCRYFKGDRPEQFHFCFNATHGLNLILQGLLEPGDHVVTTALEHNSVLRPLKKLSMEKGIRTSIARADHDGVVDPEEIIGAIQPDTKLVVMNHASNVTGTVLALDPVVGYCAARGIRTLVDASQTAGLLPIDLSRLPATYVVATGHKALRGPSGSGFIFARRTDRIQPLLAGGTGGNSISLWHPQNPQAIFEAGTPNFLGIVGLGAALEDLIEQPADLTFELALATHLTAALRNTRGIKVYGPVSMTGRISLFSFNFEALRPQEALTILDERYGIMLRAGVHCAPLAHRMLGTLPDGTLRVSLSHRSTFEEARVFLSAVREIAATERLAASI